MKLILKTHCTNEFFDGCSYALLRDGVWLACYPKHCDPLVETREIDFEAVQETQGEGSGVS
jgi:hypothetical protein